jgi:hypothetical protein
MTTQLGYDPATILTVLKLGTSLTGILSSHPKDAERFKANAEAYRLALAGQQNALQFLKYRSGRFGVETIGAPYNGEVGGWATQSAKDDAWKLYQSALASWGIGEEEMPGGGGVNNGTSGGGQWVPGVKILGEQSYAPLLLLGAGLAIVAAVSRKRR